MQPICDRKVDFLDEPIVVNSNLIILKNDNSNTYICLTRDEVNHMLSYTIPQNQNDVLEENLPIIEQPSDMPPVNDFALRATIVIPLQKNPNNWYFRIPTTGQFVNHTFREFIFQNRNSGILKENGIKVLYRSEGISGMHDQSHMTYYVEAVNRCDFYSNECNEPNTFDNPIDVNIIQEYDLLDLTNEEKNNCGFRLQNRILENLKRKSNRLDRYISRYEERVRNRFSLTSEDKQNNFKLYTFIQFQLNEGWKQIVIDGEYHISNYINNFINNATILSNIFTNLKCLYIKDMPNLEIIKKISNIENVLIYNCPIITIQSFPIKRLIVSGCNLRSLPDTMPDSLISLDCSYNPIDHLPRYDARNEARNNLEKLNISRTNISSVPLYPNLKHLECRELYYYFLYERISRYSKLEFLDISENNVIEILPIMPESLIELVAEQISIRSIHAPYLNNVKILHLEYNNKLNSVEVPRKCKELFLYNCVNLEELKLFNTELEMLDLRNCRSLRYIQGSFPNTLKYLYIQNSGLITIPELPIDILEFNGNNCVNLRKPYRPPNIQFFSCENCI